MRQFAEGDADISPLPRCVLQYQQRFETLGFRKRGVDVARNSLQCRLAGLFARKTLVELERQLVIVSSVNNKTAGFELDIFIQRLRQYYLRARSEKPWTLSGFDRFTYEDLMFFEPLLGETVFVGERENKANIVRLEFLFNPDHEEYLFQNKEVLKDLFRSDVFKESLFKRVKSPTELIVGALRKTREYRVPAGGETGLFDTMEEGGFMGQKLLDPPSVEGWHTGEEWITSGSLVDRVNFLTSHMSDMDNIGVREMIASVKESIGGADSGEKVVSACLDFDD